MRILSNINKTEFLRERERKREGEREREREWEGEEERRGERRRKEVGGVRKGDNEGISTWMRGGI